MKSRDGRVREGQRREEKREERISKKRNSWQKEDPGGCRAIWPDERWKVARHFGAKYIHFPVPMYKTPCSDRFWLLRCRKSARRCGAKHISKSKVLKTDGLGPLLEVEMSKKCTTVWREAHFEVKSGKNWWAWSTLGRSDVVLRGRHKGFCTLPKVSKTCGFCGNFNYNHYTTLHLRYTTTTITTTTAQHCTTLHCTTLHSTSLHSITHQLQLQLQLTTTTTLHYTTLITLHYANYITLRYSTLHKLQLQLQLQLRYFTLH